MPPLSHDWQGTVGFSESAASASPGESGFPARPGLPTQLCRWGWATYILRECLLGLRRMPEARHGCPASRGSIQPSGDSRQCVDGCYQWGVPRFMAFALFCCTGVAFFTNWRQDPPPAKKITCHSVATLTFFPGVWNQTHSISEVRLYKELPRLNNKTTQLKIGKDLDSYFSQNDIQISNEPI